MTQPKANEQNNLKVHGALLLAAVFYGASYSIAQQIMPRLIAPEPFILLRIWISCAVFWAVHALQLISTSTSKSPHKHKKAYSPTAKEHLRLLACAIFGIAGNMILFFKGLAVSSPVSAAVIMITTPIFILAFALLFLEEKAGLLKIGGMLIGGLGATLLIYTADAVANAGDRTNTVAGNLMVLVNALFFAIYLIMVKPLLERFDTLQLMRWLFLYGTILVTPFGLTGLSDIHWHLFNMSDRMSFWFIILGISVGAYWLNAWSLKHTRATVVGSYIYLQPLLAALFGMLWGENLHPAQFGFGSLVFIGVFMVGRAQK